MRVGYTIVLFVSSFKIENYLALNIYREFKTLIGGLISIGIFIVLTLYSYTMLRIMAEKTSTNLSIYETYYNLAKVEEIIETKNSNFTFGIRLQTKNFVNLLSDSTYATVKMYQGYYTYKDGNNETEVPIVNCTYDHFPSIGKDVLQNMRITEFICPKSNDFKIRGNNFAVDGEMHIRVRVFICRGVDVNGNTCKSEDQIKAEVNTATLYFPIVGAYFDAEDYSNPIKEYMDDFFWDTYAYGFKKATSIHIRKNTVQLQDSLFSYSPDANEKYFISHDKITKTFSQWGPTDTELLRIGFFQDNTSTTYSRQVYSLLGCLGDIGGIYGMLELVGGLLVGIFSGKVFIYSILSVLYQIILNDKKCDIKNQKESIVLNEYNNIHTEKHMSQVQELENKKLNDDSRYFNQNFHQNQEDKSNINEEYNKQHDLDPDLVEKATNSMKLRYKYNYSIYDIAYNFLFPLK